MICKIEFRPGVSRQLKKVSKEVEDWVFEVTERLSLNPTPKNSKAMQIALIGESNLIGR